MFCQEVKIEIFFEIHAPKENNWIFCVYMFRFEPIFPNSIQLESESSLEHHEELLKSKFNPTFSVLHILQFFFYPTQRQILHTPKHHPLRHYSAGSSRTYHHNSIKNCPLQFVLHWSIDTKVLALPFAQIKHSFNLIFADTKLSLWFLSMVLKSFKVCCKIYAASKFSAMESLTSMQFKIIASWI